MHKQNASEDIFGAGDKDVMYALGHNTMRLWWNEMFVEEFRSLKLSWYIHGTTVIIMSLF